MESVKRKKIFVFLISIMVIVFTLGILGLVKDLSKKEDENHGKLNLNETEGNNFVTPDLYYKILKLENGVFESVEAGYDGTTLTLKDKVINSVQKVNLYKIDELLLVTLEQEEGKLNVFLLDKEYNEVYTNDMILKEYPGFYITSVDFNKRGILIDAVNPVNGKTEAKPNEKTENTEEILEEKEEDKVIEKVKLLIKYNSTNTFGEILVLDTVIKDK